MYFHSLLWKGILRTKYFLTLRWGRQRHINPFYPNLHNWQWETLIFNFKCLRLYTKFELINNCAIYAQCTNKCLQGLILKYLSLSQLCNLVYLRSPSNTRNYKDCIKFNQSLTNSRKSFNNGILTKGCLQSKVIHRILDRLGKKRNILRNNKMICYRAHQNVLTFISVCLVTYKIINRFELQSKISQFFSCIYC